MVGSQMGSANSGVVPQTAKRGTPRCRQTAVERPRSFDFHFRSPRSAQHVGEALFEVYLADRQIGSAKMKFAEGVCEQQSRHREQQQLAGSLLPHTHLIQTLYFYDAS